MNLELTWRKAAAACFTVCLAGSLPAVAQSQASKPEASVEKPQNQKEKTTSRPRRSRESSKHDAGEERPRLDVPVSFPVNI